jgi:hypothetical protein
MIPTMPTWSWAIAAVFIGGGIVWYLWRRLKQAEDDRVQKLFLESQQKAEAIVAAAEREVENVFKQADKAKADTPPTAEDFKF